MKLSEAVKSLMERGGTNEQILGLILAAEAPEREREEKRREKARLRKQAQRAKQSPIVTQDKRDNAGQHGTAGDTGGTHAGARAEPKITNSSVPIPEIKKEKQESTASAKPKRVACLMPDDFEPDPGLVDKAVREWGYTPDAVREKRDALHDWSHGKGEKRVDWNAVLSGALRNDRHRPSTGPPGNGRAPKNETWADIFHATTPDAIERNKRDAEPEPKQLDLKALPH